MSDLLIKGMKMPKNCCECWFMEGADEWCCAHRGRYLEPDYRYGIKDKPDWCPLVEVPPHGRLIDAEVLVDKHFGKEFLSKVMTANKDDLGTALVNVPLVINNAPIIIPAEEAE